eukprot:gnl/TRDRNA2_/TRDRNA2_188987_c0_seq1.p1 gnl/TRDRNA2_/TRDRNA2_188987_c0~~gnl/TRDRNA2_/TRDRNA2_188987_c0_seq1.p1  ORF type:complete len:134 (+),score=24.49 gnl/TRDRNA2_/TRDRNA2_188987_c0_seq1:145-546(+)
MAVSMWRGLAFMFLLMAILATCFLPSTVSRSKADPRKRCQRHRDSLSEDEEDDGFSFFQFYDGDEEDHTLCEDSEGAAAGEIELAATEAGDALLQVASKGDEEPPMEETENKKGRRRRRGEMRRMKKGKSSQM